MNANLMDYSYSKLDVPFKKVTEGLLTKAVRVTTAVKDKIKNGYKKNFTVEGIEKQQVDLVNKMVEQMKPEEPKPVEPAPVVAVSPTPVVATAIEDEKYLISKTVNETTENLVAVRDKLNQLEEQKKVIATIKRVALYTKELAKLTARVTKKWFDQVPSVEKEVVPVAEVKPFEPVIPVIANTQELTKPDEIKIENNQASEGPALFNVPTPQPVSIAPFNWETITKGSTETKVVDTPVAKENVEVSQPKAANDSNPFKFDFPSFVQKSSAEPKATQFSSVESTVDQRTSNVLPFAKKDDAVANNQPAELPTRGAINARIYRLNEYIKELTSEIRKLKAELDASKSANASSNDKASAYEKVNSNLSSKIVSLTEQVTSISAELEKAKESRKETIASYEEKISTMKTEYDSAMAKAADEKESIRAEYQRKLDETNAKYKEDIAKINSDYKQTMQSIYESMQNISGEEEMPLTDTKSTMVDPYAMSGVYLSEEPQRRMVA